MIPTAISFDLSVKASVKPNGGDDRSQRILVIAGEPGEGPLTEPTSAVLPSQALTARRASGNRGFRPDAWLPPNFHHDRGR
jgi:hypothetical protein